jgi:hypothetical protein
MGINLDHHLNSECGFLCPIAELHVKAREIIAKYPALNLVSGIHYEMLAFSQGQEVFLNAAEKTNPLNKSQNHFATERVITPRLRVHQLQILRGIRPTWVLFNDSEDFSDTQLQEIATWHVSIIKWALGHPGVVVPLMKIQVLWIARITRGSKYDHLGWLSGKLLAMTLNDSNTPANILRDFSTSRIRGARLRALENPSMPETILESACLDPSAKIRIAASNNPSCTEEGQVSAALLQDIDY